MPLLFVVAFWHDWAWILGPRGIDRLAWADELARTAWVVGLVLWLAGLAVCVAGPRLARAWRPAIATGLRGSCGPRPTAYLLGVSRTRTFHLPLPLDLRRSLAPLRMSGRDPTIRLADDQVLRATWTPEGPATLHARVATGEAVCEAWGPGTAWALEQAPGLLGALDDLRGFDPARDPAVARYAHRLPGLRMIRTGQVADVLAPTILGQKVTGLEAWRAWRYLVHRYGAPAPGPGALRLPPHPDTLAGLPYHAYHRAGVERARAVTIIEACRRIGRLQEAATMSRSDARRRLTAVRGLGPWTAAIVQRVALGDADAVEIGDYHLPNVVAWHLAGEPRADDARMLELLAPFAPHRGRTLRLVELGGRGAPRYGPRMPVGPIHRL